MLKIDSFEDAYSYTLKAEDKLERKCQSNPRGKGQAREQYEGQACS